MKKLILFLSLFVAFSYYAYSQVSISNPVRLTTGNNDRNPLFGNGRVYFAFPMYEWEFMTFERISGSYSNICVTKVGDSGSFGGEYNITNDLFVNKNPSIAYNKPVFVNGWLIKYAVIVWQSNKFGRQSVFMSTYKTSTGWSSPFILDSSNTDNVSPKVCSLDSINFSIVYQSGNDIKYKKYNISTNIFSLESNLTNSDPNNCSNPQIKIFRDNINVPRVWITYEREISTDQKGIYFTSALLDSVPPQSGSSDTIAFTGINRSLGFGNDMLGHYSIFESERNGSNTNIYGTSFLQHTQTPIVENTTYDFTNYTGGDFGITDNSGFQNMIYSHNFETPIGINVKITFSWWSGYTATHKISNNPLYQTSISINSAIRVPGTTCEQHWFVYNKDSLNPAYPSTIYGVFYTNCLTGINPNYNSTADNFSLNQNYPNPFNPKTNIKFSIPKSSFVTLKVYDMLGKEIASLVNEDLSAGVYSFDFNAGGLASGVYFYKLIAGDYTDIKKMTLLK